MSKTHCASSAPVESRPNAAFRLDRVRGSFVIDTPRTSGGFVESGSLDCGVLSFEVEGAPATVWASSVDEKGSALATSGRMAVFHLTDVQADGNLYLDETKRTLLKWGKAPSVMRSGSAKVTLRLANPSAYDVWSVGSDGVRRERIPALADDGVLRFTASVRGADGARFAYEVVSRGAVGRSRGCP